jgi:hypothetical protein
VGVFQICGFETGDSGEANATAGTFSIQSSVKRTGSYALRVNPTTTGTGHYRVGGERVSTAVAFSVATLYGRFYFRYATKPAANNEPFMLVADDDVSPNIKMELRLNSAGNILVYDQAGTGLLATGATALAQDTWYLIEFSCGNGASAAYEVKIDGVSEVSGTGNLQADNAGRVYLGKWVNRNGQTVDFFYDDVALSDSGFIGAGQSIMLLPNAVGTYDAFSIGAGAGAKYEQLDDVPHDSSTTYIVTSGAAGQAQTVGFQTMASAGVYGAVNAVKAIFYLAHSGVTGQVQTRVTSGGSDFDSIDIGTTSGTYSEVERFYATDPATASAWSRAGVNAIEAGIEERDTDPSRWTFAGLLVDYIPSASSGQMRVILCG